MLIHKELIQEAEAVYEGAPRISWLFREADKAGITGPGDKELKYKTYYSPKAETWNEVRFMFAYLILLEAGEEE